MGEPILTETRHGGDGPLVINGLEDLQARVGQDLGVSSWRTVKQSDINTFAKLTGDEQWIHVDPERAKTGMYGTTVQHGFLTLGLATGFLWEVCTIDGFGIVLNYGLNKVRFPAGSEGRQPHPHARETRRGEGPGRQGRRGRLPDSPTRSRARQSPAASPISSSATTTECADGRPAVGRPN